MKNSLSKTLLCGVLASTFFMINCQKVPSRGVKADKGVTDTNAGAGNQQKVDLTNKVMVTCSNEFIAKYKISSDLVAKLKTEKLENLDDAQKKSLEEKAQTAGAKTDEAIAEITKIKENADGCSITDPKSKSTLSYLIENIRNEIDQVLLSLKEKSGVNVEQTKKAESNKLQRQQDVANASLSEEMKLLISGDLAKVMKKENVDGAVYFRNSEIIEDKQIEKALEDKSKTICKIASLEDETMELKESDEVSVVSPRLGEKQFDRSTLNVIMTKGNSIFSIKCYLADKKDNFKLATKEFRIAFGKHLKAVTAQKKVESTTKVADATAEKLKADLDAKEKKMNDLKEKVEKLDAELTDLKAQVMKAKDAKDKASEDKLMKAGSAKKEQKQVLEKQLEKATQEKEAAQKAYDAAIAANK